MAKNSKNPTPATEEFTGGQALAPTDRARNMFVELYCTPDRWTALLASKQLEHYAWIYHDKDVRENGTLKTPHYHLLLVWNQSVPRQTVDNLIDLTGLTQDTTILVERALTKTGAFQYLTHTSKKAIEAGKTIYDQREVKMDDPAYWYDLLGTKGSNDDFVRDLMDGTLSSFDMAVKYGRDYMKNATKYDEFKHRVEYEQANAIEKARRQRLQEGLTAFELEDADDYAYQEAIKNSREDIPYHLAELIAILQMEAPELQDEHPLARRQRVAESFVDQLLRDVSHELLARNLITSPIRREGKKT